MEVEHLATHVVVSPDVVLASLVRRRALHPGVEQVEIDRAVANQIHGALLFVPPPAAPVISGSETSGWW